MKNLLPRFGITPRFVDITDLSSVRAAITPRTRVLYCESIGNPLLEVSDIPELASLAQPRGVKLVVDNTFSPMILSPLRLGADVVVHSMTKFINGTSDCVAGCVVSSQDLIDRLNNVHDGTSMLLGPVLDSFRAASILKNLHSLHIRMRQHGANALHLAECLQGRGERVHYPGLESHAQHALLDRLRNAGYGHGGMLTLDVGDAALAEKLMVRMQEEKVGYLAVSLGYFKTLFSAPSLSTSSEIPADEQRRIGLGPGLVRFSVGLDADFERSCRAIQKCLVEARAALPLVGGGRPGV
jgi:methionine-gamma-lyase